MVFTGGRVLRFSFHSITHNFFSGYQFANGMSMSLCHRSMRRVPVDIKFNFQHEETTI